MKLTVLLPAIAVASALAALAAPARAQGVPEPDESHNVLPESWDLSSVSHFRVGVLVEQSFDDQDLRSTPALGLSVNYRNRWLSPNLRVVLRPAQSIEDTYAAVGVGVSADSVLNSPEIDPVFLAEQKGLS